MTLKLGNLRRVKSLIKGPYVKAHAVNNGTTFPFLSKEWGDGANTKIQSELVGESFLTEGATFGYET